MRARRRQQWNALWPIVLLLLAACGGTPATPPPQASPPAATATAEPTAAPHRPAPVAQPTPTAVPAARMRPNELGLIPVLMYHYITDEPGEWNRSPDQFRRDLEYLYAHDYYLTPLRQYVDGNIAIPAGKTPVILTFDDGAESQFRYLVQPDGSKIIDPDCAVGILEEMYARHPDFGRAATFYILPLLPFGDDDDKHDQRRFAKEKLEFLLANGYELGNHTLNHANLRQADDERIKRELAEAVDAIHGFVPGAPVETIALPFGMYPPRGDTTLLEGFTHNGRTYRHRAALMVGAEPAPSPFDTRRDLMWTPRIRADDDELVKWFGGFFEQQPELRYVSDGDSATVAVPRDLPPALSDKLDAAKLGNRQLVRSDP